jgi:DNA-binding LacI/PurR family transcriptional regulator
LANRTRRARIDDVADAAGVSKTAVSFAFNNPDRLRADTASRIRDIAEQLGYRPNPVARMLSAGRTLTMGVLTPQALAVVFSNPFFGEFSAGVARTAEHHGYGLHFISPRAGSLATSLAGASVDGVVALGLSGEHPEVEHIRSAGVPVVVVDVRDIPELSGVVIDDEGGAHAAANHLLELGHRDFMVIAMEPPLAGAPLDPHSVMGMRLAGYRRALAVHDLSIPDQAVLTGPASIDGGIRAFRLGWERGDRPTAVLAASDAMAIGAMRAARDLGLRVPGDLSVVGFDDIDLARYTDPALTTVHQPIREKGEHAAHLLLRLIADEAAAPVREQLPTHLVVRGSTGPVPVRRQEVPSN